jgi:hypothetical protein
VSRDDLRRAWRKSWRSIAIFAALLAPIWFLLPSTGHADGAVTPKPLLSGGNGVPPVYAGFDAMRNWAQWYLLEIGPRMAGRSTSDPSGSNADNIGIIRRGPGGRRTLFEREGPGVLLMARFQEDYGQPWNLAIDSRAPFQFGGADVGQTAPTTFPATAWQFPLASSIEANQGSTLIQAPMSFREKLSIEATTWSGNFYSMFKAFPYGSPLTTWTGSEKIDDVVALMNQQAPSPASVSKTGTSMTFSPRQGTLLGMVKGPAVIRRLTFSAPVASAAKLGNTTLRIWWDGEMVPSVNLPIKFLAGAGGGVTQSANRTLVNAFPVRVSGDGNRFYYTSAFPMPFNRSARVELSYGGLTPLEDVNWEATVEPLTVPSSWFGTFHANYASFNDLVPGQDLTLLDVRGTGKIVGTVINFGSIGDTLEGDIRFYLDDAQTPQIAVTGTEEWGLGGNYWRNGNEAILPLGGHPLAGTPSVDDFEGEWAYRYLLADAVTFNRRALVTLEHGGDDGGTIPYRTSVLWYSTPYATAKPTDELIVGDDASRGAHGYLNPSGQAIAITGAYPYAIASPQYQMAGFSSSNPVSFTLALDPANIGAFLRRTYDYGVADQRAEVWLDGRFAGVWFNPGYWIGNDAFGVPRRIWDEEFALPPDLTAGKSKVTVEMRPVIGGTATAPAWTELRYQLYSLTAAPSASAYALYLPEVHVLPAPPSPPPPQPKPTPRADPGD